MTPTYRILRLQSLQPEVNPVAFSNVLVSGISSVCPITGGAGSDMFEMK